MNKDTALTHVMRKVLYLLMVVVVFSGCAYFVQERTMEEKVRKKTFYEIDLSTGDNKGILKIQARPPSQQYAVSTYRIVVDHNEPIIISKHSDLNITLDQGEHNLTISAIPDFGPFGETFGKVTEEKIHLSKNDTLVAKYIGPFWLWSQGKFNIVE